jgi:glutamate dehydrogenase
MHQQIAAEATQSDKAKRWISAGVPEPLAARIASADGLYYALDAAEIADSVKHSLAEVGEVFVGIGSRLGLARLRAQIGALPADSHWQTLAKVALADDLAGLQRAITQDAIAGAGGAAGEGAAAMLAAWEARNAQALERAQRLLAELADAKHADLAMLSVALRELRNLG